MEIRNKRILNVLTRLAAVPDGAELRIMAEIEAGQEEKLARLGFGATPRSGDTLLPCGVGPVSRFNAEGRWLVLRDQPKEPRYIRTVHWTWRQWAGRDETEEQSDFRDIFRDCYPREFVPPPGLELTCVGHDSKWLIVSRVFHKRPDEHEAIRHAINLFLELFRVCEIVGRDLERFVQAPVRRVNWRLLPPGRYPWERLEGHLQGALRGCADNVVTVTRDRLDTLKSHRPDEIYVGEGGFDDYLGYVFRSRGVVVLESIRKDNALYLFGDRWERFSRLSKAEVLSNNHHLDRIIHAQGWKTRLAQVLRERGKVPA